MKIGLISTDGMKFPNLALMKIATYHKLHGDKVEFAIFGHYDKLYISKIFNFTPEQPLGFITANEIIKGGTGYNIQTKLPNCIDGMIPDYSLYNITDTSYGFTTRGCNNRCKWCVVPEKEGLIKPYMAIEQIARNNKKVVLMDNNILASSFGIKQIEKIIKLNLKVDFNQGLDCRLVNKNILDKLVVLKWLNYIRFACDSQTQIKPLINVIEKLLKKNIKKYRFSIYLLLNNDINECYNRAKIFRDMGIHINPQPYRDFNLKNKVPQWQKDFARWGTRKQLYDKIDFIDFKPRKNFICKDYF